MGEVFNNTTGVLIDVEGDRNHVEDFINDLAAHPPPLSRIESIERNDDWMRGISATSASSRA